MHGKSPWDFRSAQEQKSKTGLTGIDWQSLLHPANAFSHPNEVVRDNDLTVNEKRAILAAWASDASAVISNPALRRGLSSDRPVTFDEVMEALRSLDKLAVANQKPAKHIPRTTSPWRWPREGGQAWQGRTGHAE